MRSMPRFWKSFYPKTDMKEDRPPHRVHPLAGERGRRIRHGRIADPGNVGDRRNIELTMNQHENPKSADVMRWVPLVLPLLALVLLVGVGIIELAVL